MAVGHDHESGVLHAWIGEQLARQTRHLDALTSALGVPHHSTLLVAIRPAGLDDPFDGFSDGMKLVIGGDLLDDLPVFLKEAKMTNELQQTPFVEDPPHQGL